MKTLSTIQKLSRIGKVLSKIAFIFSIIGFCGCIAGLLSLNFDNGSLIKIGGVTLHGLIYEEYGYNIKSITAALSGWVIICAGEAVLAKFAEAYFKNELAAGTPFTLDGAKEMLRLGILTICIPLGCLIVAEIVSGIIAGLLNCDDLLKIENDGSVALGIMFIVMSVLCRYGADDGDPVRCIGGCHTSSTFDGNKISEADRFQMEYSVLNQQEGASLALTAGDAIMVSIAQESGTVDVVVGMDEKEPIYEGNGLTNTSFTLNILQSGTYQITVTGHDACGNVSFTKVTAKPEVNRN